MKAWQKIVLAVSLLGMAVSCRNDPAPQKPKVEKITFEESVKTIYVGDTVKINVAVEPKNAKESNKIEYSVTESGIIEIKEDSGNDGVVFEGTKRGATVITAKADGVVDYCSVNVLGGSENVIPHIIVPYYVMECRENERRSIVASLVGGTPLDDSGFIWSYSNQRVISLESTGNVGVFDTLSLGDSVVTISHPKAQFSVDVLVYVIGNDEIPIYITTDNNVVNLKTTDSNYQYAVELRGGDSGDYYSFSHELLDGSEVIELRVNNNIGTINPKAKGIARIGIIHPKAAYRLEIVVIVNEEVKYRYIDVDKTLIIMEEGYSEILKAELIGDASQNHLDKYTFENENDGVITVQQSHDQFRITGLQRGRSVVKIKNEYADFDREVLVIVNGIGSMQDNEIYITTNQNVITTEAGGDDVLLTMTLVGGNEADRNNFVWTVDDGSIISVESAHGRVEYKNRSAVSNIGEQFEAQAVVKAKKVGTAKITLENPKAKNKFSVIVKVYKKGVFDVVPVVVDGPSVYKVRIGEQLPAYLQVVTGNVRNFTNVTWESANSTIVSASGTGLTGMLEGKSAGITTVTVSGDNVKHDYTATIIVGDDTYLQTMPFMYVLNPFMSVIRGESVSFRIRCENMSREEIAGINVVNNSGDLMEVFAYKDSVTVTGLALGEGEIIIGGSALNTVRVVVMVEDYDLNPDMPYYLRTDKFIYGLVKGHNLEIGVDLVGGSAVNERNIGWKIEDSNVAMISENGKKCMITGRNTGQTVITVGHLKSHNELEIVIYVVEKESELNSKVVMYVKEANMLLNSGETRYVSIITNANDAQKNSFQWNISNSNVIDVSISGDRIKAYVAAKSVGSTVITVRSGSQTVPVVIYISVISRAYGRAYINVPSIVEMAAGETLSISAVTNDIKDRNNIIWSVKDENIAVVYGNGDTCLVNAFKGGGTVITVEYKPAGFVKDIILYVYNSVEEMASRYIIAGDQSRYVINRGDIVNIHLVFGMKGYPEHELYNIWWRTNDATVIEVTGNGKTANVKGLNAGTGIITVGSNNDISNTVEIEVEVREGGKAGQYWFSINERDRIKGILAGSYADIEVRVFNGSNEVFNISGIDYIVEDNDIISVEKNGNVIRVQAAAGKEGQSYITVQHDSVEDARILIYTALSEYGLENAYPVLVDKVNYLIKKGENVTVTVQTKDNDNTKLNNISYGLERNNGVISVSERNRREIVVNTHNVGSDVILVRYNAQVVQRIYVSVTEGNYGSNAGYMVTENIIGLLWATEYETKVETDADGVIWKKQNDYVIDIVSSSGKSAVIKGTLLGRTVLTVSAGDIERNIAVFVCETEEELRQYQAINIEQRKYRIRKNESVTVNIHSYQGRVEGQTRYGDYYNYNDPYGNVIAVNAVENNKFSVKGINEGMAAIRVTNEFYRTEIVVYIEVAAAGEGDTGIVDRRHYMSAQKTLYVIGMEEQNVMMSVDVIGGDFYGDAYWIWSDYDDSIISVNATGRSAAVNPVKEGQTKIKVSNKDCANTLEIMVIMGARFAVDDSLLPYIYVEKNLYEVMKDEGSISIPYSIVNVDNVNIYDVSYRWANSGIIRINHDPFGVFNVTVLETGIARFEIVYGNLSREVYVLVKENMNLGNIYLTTSENYVVASIGELRTVNIQLAGYDEINSNNFIWSVEPKYGVVTLVGNGTTGQIYGMGEGDAVITVSHPKAGQYSLKINVKVVKDRVKESVIYLTTQRNVIETVVGTATEQIYVQKIGGDVNKNRTTWTVSDSSIVDITPQGATDGYAAQLTPKKEGVARIQVTNVETGSYVLEIVVIVRAALKNNIYIDSVDTLLLLSPGEVQRRISVVLVNGDVKDNNKFKWSIDHQEPSDVNLAAVPGSKVVDIVGSNEECFINAVNEGIAKIRVSNPDKAERDLIITVYVTHYKEINFSVSRKEIVIGENEFVGINLPTYESFGNKVRVWVEQIDGSSGSDICEVFYTNELVLLSGKKAGVVIVKAAVEGKEGEAQLYVTVVAQADPNVNRIILGKTLHVLNPKSNPLLLNASVSGPNVFDVDNDNIKWELRGTPGVIDIMPKNDPVSSAKGSQVQITPKKSGTATILVWHGYVDEAYYKEISVIVADTNNIFSVSRTDIELNSLRPETVSAEIVGGTTRDYAEIKWTVKMQQKWDGTMLEIVRIMGSGREVTLYPINDGQTEVFAIYGGKLLTIKVAVVSDYYFSFRNGNEFMYPREIRDLPFDVRPASSNVNWINVTVDPNEAPVVTYGEVLGSSPGDESGTVVRYLQVRALREGTASITGMANNKISQVNIIVQYDYSFNADKNVHGHPKYYGMVGGRQINETGEASATYTVYPPNTYIKPDAIPDGLEIEIGTPVIPEKDVNDRIGGPGVGTIKFTGHRELMEKVTFQQYKAKDYGDDKDTPVEGNTFDIYISYAFPVTVEPVPFLIRGDGIFSNSFGKTNPKQLINGTWPEKAEKINGSGLNYTIDLGDGEEHYILFDKQYDTAILEITGLNGLNEYTLDGTNYKLSLVNIEIDGISRQAVRLSGGNDYIEYNRVAFNQELFMHVKSNSIDIGDIPMVPSPLYDSFFLLPYTITAQQYEGQWYRIYHPQTYVSGEETPSRQYYFIKDSWLNSQESSMISKIYSYNPRYVAEDPWLDVQCSNSDYTYYLSGNEVQAGSFPQSNVEYLIFQSILQKCDLVKVHQPAFYYMWDVYVANTAIFNASGTATNTSNLNYATDPETGEDTNEIIGGYVASYGVVGSIVERTINKEMMVYMYNETFIENLYQSDIELPSTLNITYDNEENVSISLDKGMLNPDKEALITKESGYVYSGIPYTILVPDVNIAEGNFVETRRNVFSRKFIENGTESDTTNGVYINDNYGYSSGSRADYNYIPSAEYNSNGKYAYGWHNTDCYSNADRYLEYLSDFYRNMMKTPSYNHKGLVESTNKAYFSGQITLNGTVKSLSTIRKAVQVTTQSPYPPYQLSTTTRYDYTAHPPNEYPNPLDTTKKIRGNKSDQNIFGYDLQTYDFKEGVYGPDYYYGDENMTHGVFPNGNCRWTEKYHDPRYGVFYSLSKAQQKLQWEYTGRTVIVPYYYFNRFPFRYESSDPSHIILPDKNIVKLTDGGGKPMPSINKTATTVGADNIAINFKTFDFGNGQNVRNLTLAIKFEKRKCHMMYTGNQTDDGFINYVNTGGIVEFEGEVQSYSDSYFDDPAQEKIKKFLQ